MILTIIAIIDVILLTMGTLATLAGSEALTNKSVNGVTLATGGSASLFLNQQGSYVADEVLISLAANQTSSVVTYADVTGFVVPVVAGKTYKIEILAMFSSNTITTG